MLWQADHGARMIRAREPPWPTAVRLRNAAREATSGIFGRRPLAGDCTQHRDAAAVGGGSYGGDSIGIIIGLGAGVGAGAYGGGAKAAAAAGAARQHLTRLHRQHDHHRPSTSSA